MNIHLQLTETKAEPTTQTLKTYKTRSSKYMQNTHLSSELRIQFGYHRSKDESSDASYRPQALGTGSFANQQELTGNQNN